MFMRRPPIKISTGMLTFSCHFCANETDVPITQEKYHSYITGPDLIQDFFPELNPSQREAMQTGICDSCWEKIPF